MSSPLQSHRPKTFLLSSPIILPHHPSSIPSLFSHTHTHTQMKVVLPFFHKFHLDEEHYLLSARALQILHHFFVQLDVRDSGALDDVAFEVFMDCATDLRRSEILRVFDMLDVDDSGDIEFDEFYLLVCIMLAIKDGREKQFLFRHARTCFELLDEDGSGTISVKELRNFGFLFGFSASSVRSIFKEFDVTGDKELTYNEFRMFSFACMDREKELQQANANPSSKTCAIM